MPTPGARRPFSEPSAALYVYIDHVDGEHGYAYVHDAFGNRTSIPLTRMASKGLDPAPGERWIIARSFGRYSFVSMASGKRGPLPVDSFDMTSAWMFG